jgi:hypothetical protein
MPSTTSSVVSMPLASSTVIVPSLPTFSIASAMMAPIPSSLFAEIEATFLITLRSSRTCLLIFGQLDDGRRRRVDAALDRHRVRARGHVAQPFAEDGFGEDRRRRRAVTGHVRRLRGDLLDHLRAHVLVLVLELDFLGDRDAVLGDRGCAPLLVEHDVAALRAERRLDGAAQFRDAVQARRAVLLLQIQVA